MSNFSNNNDKITIYSYIIHTMHSPDILNQDSIKSINNRIDNNTHTKPINYYSYLLVCVIILFLIVILIVFSI